MAFQEILDNLLKQVPGSIAATLNDKDGEPICSLANELPNEALQMLGAYRGLVKRHLQLSVEEFDPGTVEQVAFCTPRHWILMADAQEDCSLVLVMHRKGIIGRARFEMARALDQLNKEI